MKISFKGFYTDGKKKKESELIIFKKWGFSYSFIVKSKFNCNLKNPSPLLKTGDKNATKATSERFQKYQTSYTDFFIRTEVCT